MKDVIKILTTLILHAWAIHAGGQMVTATTTLDTNSIMIGDQIGMHLELSVPQNSTVYWPDFIGDTVASKVEILERSVVDTVLSKDDFISYHQRLLITCFDSGLYVIRPIPFKFMREHDTTEYYLQTEPLFLKVVSPETDPEAGLQPIKPPIHAPVTLAEILPWAIGILILLGLTALILYIIRKKKRQEPVFQFKPKPQLPPYTLALQDLETLRKKKLWQSGKVKMYYTELTDIIRLYIEKRYQINALEMTTDEIIRGLKNAGISNGYFRKLGDSLLLADLVKFAKAQPLPVENDASINNCIGFVNETKPKALDDVAI